MNALVQMCQINSEMKICPSEKKVKFSSFNGFFDCQYQEGSFLGVVSILGESTQIGDILRSYLRENS